MFYFTVEIAEGVGALSLVIGASTYHAQQMQLVRFAGQQLKDRTYVLL